MKSSKQQRKGRQFQKRLLRLESLEDRRLMAANVTFNQGLLSIEGTSANDHIVIGQRVVELSPVPLCHLNAGNNSYSWSR